jgi:hypothetical protein
VVLDRWCYQFWLLTSRHCQMMIGKKEFVRAVGYRGKL